ncbi:hypothetical protein ACFXKR_25515 [Streptomyces violascens]|uniref:hypothetical protein n=1 Tax=Streptomyces violascens TaxID=67381 RepID=UPI0036BD2A5C
MATGSVIARSWRSFTGHTSAHIPPSPGRGWHGHTLRRRVWASFTGAELRPARSHGPLPDEALLDLPSQPAPDRSRSRSLAPGWFTLPRLPQGSGLAAAGGDAVLIEASSPDGRARFLVRGPGITAPEHRLELILDTAGTDRPLMTVVSYPEPDGTEQLLLVPVVRGRFGPPASYVRLPGFDAAATLTASGAVPVTPNSSWTAAQVAASVGAALNDATREAWRQVREMLVDEGLRAVIDRGLR